MWKDGSVHTWIFRFTHPSHYTPFPLSPTKKKRKLRKVKNKKFVLAFFIQTVYFFAAYKYTHFDSNMSGFWQRLAGRSPVSAASSSSTHSGSPSKSVRKRSANGSVAKMRNNDMHKRRAIRRNQGKAKDIRISATAAKNKKIVNGIRKEHSAQSPLHKNKEWTQGSSSDPRDDESSVDTTQLPAGYEHRESDSDLSGLESDQEMTAEDAPHEEDLLDKVALVRQSKALSSSSTSSHNHGEDLLSPSREADHEEEMEVEDPQVTHKPQDTHVTQETILEGGGRGLVARKGKGGKGKKASSKRKSDGPRTHQLNSINTIKDDMGYNDIVVSKSAKKVISHASVHFGKLILGAAGKVAHNNGHARTTYDDIRGAMVCVIPAPEILLRMHDRGEEAALRYHESMRNRTKEDKPISGEKRAGLYVKLAHVKNLCKTFGSIETSAHVYVAAAMEEIIREILQKCVGLLIRGVPDMEGGPAHLNQMRFTVTADDVNVVLKRIIRTQDVNDMAARHPFFRHRKKDLKEEVEVALKKNAENQPVKKKRKKKRAVMKTAARVVEKHNNRSLLKPNETLFLIVQANALPIIFKDFKIPAGRTIPNVRTEMLPEKMQKKSRHEVNASIGRDVLDESMCMKVLVYLADEFIHTKEASAWMASRRK